jgi:TRAP-type C4-dicarboxylate transport system permease small subunit
MGEPTDPRVTAMLLIRSALRFITIIVFCYMLYAGFRWMTAGGNEEQITEAKKIIRNCVIGLIVITSAYSITYFAITLAQGAVEHRVAGDRRGDCRCVAGG